MQGGRGNANLKGLARKVIDGDIRQVGRTDSGSRQRQDEKDEKDENVRRKGGRKGVGVGLEGGERMTGLAGGETTPNVNTNYSPCASVASAAALHPMT